MLKDKITVLKLRTRIKKREKTGVDSNSFYHQLFKIILKNKVPAAYFLKTTATI